MATDIGDDGDDGDDDDDYYDDDGDDDDDPPMSLLLEPKLRPMTTMTVTRTMNNDGYRWIPMDSDR